MYGALPKKGGLDGLQIQGGGGGGGLVRKAGGVFEWACYPNAHYAVEAIIVRGVFRTL